MSTSCLNCYKWMDKHSIYFHCEECRKGMHESADAMRTQPVAGVPAREGEENFMTDEYLTARGYAKAAPVPAPPFPCEEKDAPCPQPISGEAMEWLQGVIDSSDGEFYCPDDDKEIPVTDIAREILRFIETAGQKHP